MGRLTGKVAMVTGSGGEHGFGRAIAGRLASDGADLILTDVERTLRSAAIPRRAATVRSWIAHCRSRGTDLLAVSTRPSNTSYEIKANTYERKANEDRGGPIRSWP